MSSPTDWKSAEPMVWQDGYDARMANEPRDQEIRGAGLSEIAAWQAGWDAADAEASAPSSDD